MTDDELRAYATDEMRLHDPAQQDHGYDRCEHCHYTRHPCTVYDLAEEVLRLLDRIERQHRFGEAIGNSTKAFREEQQRQQEQADADEV